MKCSNMRLRDCRMLRILYYHWKCYEAKRSYNHGSGNHVTNHGIKVTTCIQFRGNNNTLIIENGAVLLNSIVRITGNNNRVVLKKHSYVSGVEIFIEDKNCIVEVGENTFIGRNTHLACTEDHSSIIIGDKCMISASCQIRTGDSHSIVDLNGKRLNPASSVLINSHCWLGEGCKILKGVCLSENTIVSTGAIVTQSFGSNCLLAGIPAKVIKENINWDEKRL